MGQPRGPSPPLPHGSQPGEERRSRNHRVGLPRCSSSLWPRAAKGCQSFCIYQTSMDFSFHDFQSCTFSFQVFQDFVCLFIGHVQTCEHPGPPAAGSPAGSPCVTYATHFVSPPSVSICCPSRSFVGGSRSSLPNTPFPCRLGYFNLLSSPFGVSIHVCVAAVPCMEHP